MTVDLPVLPLLGRAMLTLRDHADGIVWHLVVDGPIKIDQTALIYWRGSESKADVRKRAVNCAERYLEELAMDEVACG